MDKLSDFQLRGPVKSIESTPPILAAPGLREILQFDRSGRLIERKEAYRDDGREYVRIVNNYDERGCLFASERYRDGKLVSNVAIKCNDRGEPIEEVATGSDGKKITTKYSYKFDSSGRLVETIFNLSDPIIGNGFIMNWGLPSGDYRTVFTYESAGRVVRSQSYFPGIEMPFVSSSATFNEKKEKVEESATDGETKPRIRRHFHKYNEHGDPIESSSYESIIDSNVSEVKDRFRVIDDKGTIQNGELISDRPYMILWSVTRCEYVYDSNRNWTRRTCRSRMREMRAFGPSGDVVDRAFIYYK